MKRPMKQLRVVPPQSLVTQSEDVTMEDNSYEPLSSSTGSLVSNTRP